jgi:PAS domain S-box-containing protein
MKNKTKPFVAVQLRKLHIFALILLFASFALQFPLSPALAEKSQNEILAGVHRDFPPQYSIDEKTGKPAGFAIDTMDKIAKRAGLKIRYVVFNDWPLINSALKEGRIDIIPNIGIVKDRTADMDFTIPLETYNISIFVRSTTTDIQSIDSLQGRKVAVVTFNVGLSIIQEYGKANPVIFKSFDEAFLSLLSGNTDALIYPETSVLLAARRSKLEARIKTIGKPLLEIKRAIAVGKGKMELLNILNKEIDTFIATPEYKKIYTKWYSAPEPYWNSQSLLIASGTIIALIIIIFIVLHFLSLIRLNRHLQKSIEKQKEAEGALRESEELFRGIIENASDLVYELTTEGIFTYLSPNWMELIGEPAAEAVGKSCEPYVHPDDVPSIREFLDRIHDTGAATSPDYRGLRRDGSIRWFVAKGSALRDRDGNVVGSIGIARDITERKQAEETLKQSEAKFHNLFDNALEGVYQSTPEGRLISANMAFARMFGYESSEETINTVTDLASQLYANPDDRKIAVGIFREKGYIKDFECRMRRKDDSIFWARYDGRLTKTQDGTPCFQGFIVDITDRKQAEDALQGSEERLSKAQKISHVGSWELDLSTNRLVWSDEVYRIFGLQPQEFIATYETFLDSIHPDDRNSVDAAYSSSLREGRDSYEIEHRVVQKHTHDVRYVHERCEHVRDTSGRIVRSVGMVQDITERKKAEENLKETLESLRKALGTTIQVMISAIEVRDPYTAGHQIRSSDLARAIATEMGLSQDKIEAIRMAGPIHDIGKLSIPAEILSKPTKLTNIEFSLIKEHVRTGYEMLKDVESPWPLAEIVYQHHERMDGSGYPRNLKGDDILMEARIMAVADVVESMASHRPYRPALGLNAALEEIENNKETLYDADAADACLRLFREKGFQLERA